MLPACAAAAIYGNRARSIDLVVEAEDRFHQGRSRHHATGPPHEAFEHQRLPARHFQTQAGDDDVAIGRIERKPSDRDQRRAQCFGAAHHGTQPRQKFVEDEGLGKVIVGAGLKAGDPVWNLSLGGDDDDWQRQPLLADLRNEFEAIAVGQLPIQKHGVVGAVADHQFGVAQRRNVIHHHVVPGERPSERHGHLRFILDQ